MRRRLKPYWLTLVLLAPGPGCANQTTFHTSPRGARVFINGELCGQSPCVYNKRYGFPTHIRVQLFKEGYQPRELFLDSEPPVASYLLFGFGSYLFHTFDEEYRFTLKPEGQAVTP
jgi:hypothetical protein